MPCRHPGTPPPSLRALTHSPPIQNSLSLTSLSSPPWQNILGLTLVALLMAYHYLAAE